MCRSPRGGIYSHHPDGQFVIEALGNHQLWEPPAIEKLTFDTGKLVIIDRQTAKFFGMPLTEPPVLISFQLQKSRTAENVSIELKELSGCLGVS